MSPSLALRDWCDVTGVSPHQSRWIIVDPTDTKRRERTSTDGDHWNLGYCVDTMVCVCVCVCVCVLLGLPFEFVVHCVQLRSCDLFILRGSGIVMPYIHNNRKTLSAVIKCNTYIC